MKIESKLKALEIELPLPLGPIGSYVPYRLSDGKVYLSGLGPMWDKIPQYHGKIGRELTKEEGYEAARLTGLNVVAALKDALGDLDRIQRFVYVTGYVNCTDEFVEQPYVINGFSDIIIEIFGQEIGAHGRCAVPTGTLPMNTPVEIAVIVDYV